MKKILGVVLALLCATSAFAFDNDDSIVRWKSIVGVITAPDDPATDAAENVNNPVGKVASGTFPSAPPASSPGRRQAARRPDVRCR